MEGSVVSFIMYTVHFSGLYFQEVTWFYHFNIVFILLMQLLLLSCPGDLGAYWLTNLTPKRMSLMQSLHPLLFLGIRFS
jgi:hypothetical protein